MKYKLAVFYMDGTILDTLEDLKDSTNYALSACGYPTRTLSEVRSFVGNGILKLIERAVPQGTDADGIQKVFKTFQEYYALHSADKTCPYDGINVLLKELHEAGVKTAVVSNKADFAVQDLVEKYFDGLFEEAIGEQTGLRTKPCPDMVEELLRRTNMSVEDAVFIGDSDVDFATAKNCHMDVIMVSWGFREKVFLQEQGAKVIVDTMEELKGKILA